MFPTNRNSSSIAHRAIARVRWGAALLAWAGGLGGIVARAEEGPAAIATLQSRQVELHYQLSSAISDASVELWYTRDHGATWQSCPDRSIASPFRFTAPAEGLYGFILIVHHGPQVSQPAPSPGQQPQRWVFVDSTPPLLQWDGIEPANDFDQTRRVQMRWTAHDDHFSARPIALAYRGDGEQNWQEIEGQLANLGRYDWVMPAILTRSIELRITATDRGGNRVERFIGPLDATNVTKKAEVLAKAAIHLPGDAGAGKPTSQPTQAVPQAVAECATTQPSGKTPALGADVSDMPTGAVKAFDANSVSSSDSEAEALYRRGSAHLARGEYNLAAERLQEALEHNPRLLSAKTDLAGIYYYPRRDYAKSTELYLAVLARDEKNRAALRGAALAYDGQKQYAQSRDMLKRLLAVDEQAAQSWLDLGDVLFKMGDTINARTHWERAASVDSTAADVIRKAQQRLSVYGSNLAGSKQTSATASGRPTP